MVRALDEEYYSYEERETLRQDVKLLLVIGELTRQEVKFGRKALTGFVFCGPTF